MLDQTLVDQYHEDGYTIVRKALSSQTIAALQAATDRIVERSRSLTQSDEHIELETGHSANEPRLRRIAHPVVLDQAYWEAACGDAILDCVESLIGPNIKFHHSKLNAKASKGGVAIGWHQDSAFFPHTNEDVLAVGIALDSCAIENGCLLVVPGTHKLGILNHRDEAGEFIGQITSDMDKFDPDTAAPAELEPGDISIHNASAIHGSTQNTSGRGRRLLIFEFAATDAIQLDWRMPANGYSNRIVRGGPLTHARLSGAAILPLRGDVGGAKSIFERQTAQTVKM